METQFNYLRQFAIQYKEYNKHSAKLYDTLNNLPPDVLKDILNEYGDPDRKFQPVNLLRAEVARYLLNGNILSESFVEEVKENIRKKNVEYFKDQNYKFKEELKVYPIGKRDMFANWQNPWSIFHTFIYRDKIKETVQRYLQQICEQLIDDLQLKDYAQHTVDFRGANNFGSDLAWLALYPLSKNSHQDAYQFFIRFTDKPEAGLFVGHSVKNPSSRKLLPVNSYQEALQQLIRVKEDILKLNNKLRNYFKFAPGSQASEWERFSEEGIAAVSYESLGLGDISEIETLKELNKKAGFPGDSQSNQTWNLWLFKNANKGDVVFAAKGVNTCLGIGIVEGDYYYKKHESGYNHCRKVKWFTLKRFHYKPDSFKDYKTLFRPDTFSPTKVWEFILKEYARLHPGLISTFAKYKLEYDSGAVISNQVGDDRIIDEPESRELNFWWLNAKPDIWSISDHSEGEHQTYTSRNERGNKRRIYKYFESVQPGDLMIGYESSPVKQVKGIFEITRALHESEAEGEVIEFELIEKLDIPVHWNELVNDPGLEKCEVFKNNQGSLFKLTEEEFDIIRDIIDTKNISYEIKLQREKLHDYIYSEDSDKPFIEENYFNSIVSLLKWKKNIILQGSPGVGKTFIARKLAYAAMRKVNDAQIEMVQFHQSYSYEDFIQGIRPGKTGFKQRNGVFYTFCQQAHAHRDRLYFFIIDEINRGNLSKILGELLMLIEHDKRDQKYALKLTYSDEDDASFFVPENVFIIGTMNTADRSLAIVDYALRRRFSFIDIEPNFETPFKTFLKENGLSDKLIEHVCTSVGKVNKHIEKDTNLGRGFRIGHSYFCTFDDKSDEKKWYDEIIQFEIKPLLEEIWFDNTDAVNQMIEILNF